MDKKRIIILISIFLIIIFYVFYFFHQNTFRQPETQNQSATAIFSHSPNTFLNQDITSKKYPVTTVLSNSTIVVNIDGAEQTVHMIGISNSYSTDCFGLESLNYLKKMLTGQYVYLQSDPLQPDTNSSGELMKYVYLDDLFVNEELVAHGYARVDATSTLYQFKEEFKAIENYAREGGIGLWQSGVCNNK